eukprot:c24517_g1_i1 orf=112-1398(+)
MATSTLQLALPFLQGSYASIDPSLPQFLDVLRQAGASECWHKHGTFYEHLLHVYRILKLWNAPDAVARCGMFHSSYSNSYVNLAIFQPDVDRQQVRDLIGDAAEELVHLFCIVPRQQLIYDMLLFQFSDDELVSALQSHGSSVHSDREFRGLHHLMDKLTTGIKKEVDKFRAFECRQKVKKVIPPEGITVKHIRTGEDVQVPRRLVAIFLLLTMADFVDQLYGWQDALFKNETGNLEWKGNSWTALWPGDCKPGLWMTSISRMGILLNLIVREEIETEEKRRRHGERPPRFAEIELVIPPVFNGCTEILAPADQIQARDLYWEAICMKDEEKMLEMAEPLLKKACLLNPWIGEPHVVLAQVYLSEEKYEEAQEEANEGLQLMLDWGTNWDKRMPWEGWIAWCRVLLQKAQDKTWPTTSWGILNLGLVK